MKTSLLLVEISRSHSPKHIVDGKKRTKSISLVVVESAHAEFEHFSSLFWLLLVIITFSTLLIPNELIFLNKVPSDL